MTNRLIHTLLVYFDLRSWNRVIPEIGVVMPKICPVMKSHNGFCFTAVISRRQIEFLR
jgi:uncharacterized membrane protein